MDLNSRTLTLEMRPAMWRFPQAPLQTTPTYFRARLFFPPSGLFPWLRLAPTLPERLAAAAAALCGCFAETFFFAAASCSGFALAVVPAAL
jgi:hypothetical protein